MIVYRLQDDQGGGPFAPGLGRKWVNPRSDHKNLMPWYIVWPDLLPEIYSQRNDLQFGSGCMTVNQLRRWFIEPEYFKLLDMGFKTVWMEVDEILRKDGTQCVFSRVKRLNVDVHFFKLYD